jgi:hypothetical protein
MEKRFTKSTKFEDFDEIINWNESIDDYFYDDTLNKEINHVEIKLNIASKEERVNLIIGELESIKEILKGNSTKLNIDTKIDGKDIPIRKSVNSFNNLKYLIHNDYIKGRKPPIKRYHSQIKDLVNNQLATIRYQPEDFFTDARLSKNGVTEYGVPLVDAYIDIVNHSTLEWVAERVITPIRFKEYLEKRIEVIKREEGFTTSNKLIWKGKPAHLAFVIDILIEKGYLSATPYGERTAKILLDFIEIEGYKNDKEGLGKLLHKDKYGIKDKTVIDRFNKIPHRNELK